MAALLASTMAHCCPGGGNTRAALISPDAGSAGVMPPALTGSQRIQSATYTFIPYSGVQKTTIVLHTTEQNVYIECIWWKQGSDLTINYYLFIIMWNIIYAIYVQSFYLYLFTFSLAHYLLYPLYPPQECPLGLLTFLSYLVRLSNVSSTTSI